SLGASVANVGDVTGDGVPDLAVAAPDADGGRGAVYVYNGATFTPGTFSLTSARAVLTGVVAGGHFGSSVAAAGDIDSDGIGDLIVGGAPADIGGGVAEVAFVFTGPLAGSVATTNAVLTFTTEADRDGRAAVAGL